MSIRPSIRPSVHLCVWPCINVEFPCGQKEQSEKVSPRNVTHTAMSINSHIRRIPNWISCVEEYSNVPTYVPTFLRTYVRTTWG